MHVKYIVELTEVERESLQTFVNSGSKLARKVKRAQILLAADQGYQDRDIAELVGVGTSTIYRAKKRFELLRDVRRHRRRAPDADFGRGLDGPLRLRRTGPQDRHGHRRDEGTHSLSLHVI
jgi:hypothetical protein